ncbi:MAG: hypothetical protein JSV50_07430 [Desulfobacteraceae bacterium]|nr:MAG: hypothetical protein JSV50_07430 [Desulfobacteraceae bacterium]
MGSEFDVTRQLYLLSMRGVALAEIGRIEDGMAAMKQGINISEKFGAVFRLGALYNTLGYCYSKIVLPDHAWNYNLRAVEVVRSQMDQDAAGIRLYSEMHAQATVNLMENLFDQGKLDEAWELMQSFKSESSTKDYDIARHVWASRMNYLAAQVLISRNDIDQADTFIRENLEKVRGHQLKKREGCFLRLMGEVQLGRKQSEKAIEHFWEAVEILKEVGNPRQLWQAHSSLASAFSKLKRLSEAREQWGAASEVINKVANALSDRQLREGFLGVDPIREILSKAS